MEKSSRKLICYVCGEEFEVGYNNQRRCNKCRTIPFSDLGKLRVIVERTCRQCGKKFSTTKNDAVFCSDECRNEYAIGKLKPIKCGVCGKMFVPNMRNQRYCSKECKYERVKYLHRMENRNV